MQFHVKSCFFKQFGGKVQPSTVLQLALQPRNTDLVPGSNTVAANAAAISPTNYTSFVSPGSLFIHVSGLTTLSGNAPVESVSFRTFANLTKASDGNQKVVIGVFRVDPNTVTLGAGGWEGSTLVDSQQVDTTTPLLAGLHTYMLSPALNARPGDFLGVTFINYNTTGDWIKNRDPGGDYETNYTVLRTTYNIPISTTGLAIDNSGFPHVTPALVPLTQAPDAAHIGDSMTVGAGTGSVDHSIWSFGANIAGEAIYKEYAYTIPAIYHISQPFGWVYQNAGASGQTSTQIEARFDAHVVARKPSYAIISCGINDFWAGGYQYPGCKAVIIANIESMIAKCLAATPPIQPIVTSILPLDAEIDATYETIRADVYATNLEIKAAVEAAGGWYFDCQPAMGAFDSANSRYTLNPDCSFDHEGDSAHLSLAGNIALGQEIARQIMAKAARNAASMWIAGW